MSIALGPSPGVRVRSVTHPASAERGAELWLCFLHRLGSGFFLAVPCASAEERASLRSVVFKLMLVLLAEYLNEGLSRCF